MDRLTKILSEATPYSIVLTLGFIILIFALLDLLREFLRHRREERKRKTYWEEVLKK